MMGEDAVLTIGGMTIDATVIDIQNKHNCATYYRGNQPVGKTRGTYSFTVEAKGPDFDAWARILDVFTLPDSMDLTVVYDGEPPAVLRVLRDVKPEEREGKTVVDFPIFQGPRLEDGRWTRNEAPR